MLAALLCFKVSKIVHCDLIQHAQLPVRVRWSIVVCQLHMFEAVWIGTLQRCKKYRRPTGNGLSGLRNQDRSSSVRLAYAVVSIGRESRYARTENTILRAASVTLLAVGVFFQHSKPGFLTAAYVRAGNVLTPSVRLSWRAKRRSNRGQSSSLSARQT